MRGILIELRDDQAYERCGICEERVTTEDIADRCQLCGPICRGCLSEHDDVLEMIFHKKGVKGEAW